MSSPPANDDRVPVQLAVSDNGPQMRASNTAEFMAIARIAQHFGRPATPNDHAWIESFIGHLKAEHPYLNTITDPAIARRELDTRREHYNTVRLHEGIGYVTPDDEHHGRGDAIRKARHTGRSTARALRIATRRNRRQDPSQPTSPDEDIEKPQLVSHLRNGAIRTIVQTLRPIQQITVRIAGHEHLVDDPLTPQAQKILHTLSIDPN